MPTSLIRISLWTSWGIAAAAAVAVAVSLRDDAPRGPSRAAEPPQAARETMAVPVQDDGSKYRVVPAGSAGYLYSARDEGIVYLENGLPARKVRYEFLDTIELEAARGDGKLNVSYPREEIRVIPINTL